MVKKTALLAVFLLFSFPSLASEFSLGYPASVDPTTYGAKCDGTTDDTVAFSTAFAFSNKNAVYVPVSVTGCAICGLNVPKGKALLGYTGDKYGGVPTDSTSRIVPTSTCPVLLLNIDGATIKGIDFYAGGFGESPSWTNSKVFASGGSSRATLDFNNIRFFGGGVFTATNISGNGGDNYTRALKSSNNVYYGNGQGASSYAIRKVVDSYFTADTLTSNYGGFDFSNGSNSNSLTGLRIEWNVHFGIKCVNSADMTVNNVQFDRNYDGDWSLTGCSKITDIGGYKRRAGRTNTAGLNASIYSGGGNNNIRLMGTVYSKGVNDDGSGTLSPAYIFYQAVDTDTNFYITDNNMIGAFVTGFAVYAGSGNGIVVTGNSGVTDKP